MMSPVDILEGVERLRALALELRAAVEAAKAAMTEIAGQKPRVGDGDVLFAHVWVDPANPPREIMLQWFGDGAGWDHRAFWGEDVIAWGVPGTVRRHRVGDLPATDHYVRIAVPARMPAKAASVAATAGTASDVERLPLNPSPSAMPTVATSAVSPSDWISASIAMRSLRARVGSAASSPRPARPLRKSSDWR